MAHSVRLRPCPACGRSTNPHNRACPYCGHSFVQQQAVQPAPSPPPPADPPQWAAPAPQHAPPSNAVPVWVLGCRYRWMSDEPGAFARYTRIGIGITLYGLLIGIAGWIGATFGFVVLMSATERTAVASVILSALISIVVTLLVIGFAIGGILRLLRDAFTHRIG